MSFSQRFVVVTFRGLTSLICRVDDAALQKVSMQGPLILYTNHVNILEIPILYTHLQPRRVHGMVLARRWEKPFFRWLLDVTESIPIQRGEGDISAIRKGLETLEKGEILIIAPEGTRSGDGVLLPAHPGVVLLALHSGAALVPVVYYGAENYKQNLSRLKRTDFHLGVGMPFRLNARGEKVTRQVRQQMVQEMMFQLASILPSQYRGQYSDSSAASPRYIDYI